MRDFAHENETEIEPRRETTYGSYFGELQNAIDSLDKEIEVLRHCMKEVLRPSTPEVALKDKGLEDSAEDAPIIQNMAEATARLRLMIFYVSSMRSRMVV